MAFRRALATSRGGSKGEGEGRLRLGRNGRDPTSSSIPASMTSFPARKRENLYESKRGRADST